MALIKCPDCGLLVSDLATSCVSCGRPLSASAAAAAKPESAAGAAVADVSAGWFLHSRSRSFGPMAAHEIRVYFTSGMVRGEDSVSGPGLAGNISAAEAAALLQVPPPPPPVNPVAVRPATVSPPATATVGTPASPMPGASTVEQTSSGTNAAASPTPVPIPDTIGFRVIEKDPWKGWQGLAVLVAGLLIVALVARQLWPSGSTGTSATVPTQAAANTGAPPARAAAQTGDSPVATDLGWDEAAGQAESNNGPAGVMNVPGPPDRTPGEKDWYGFARALTEKNDWAALLSLCLDWTQAKPNLVTAWTFLGIAYSGMSQHTEAVNAYRTALKIDPNDVVANNNLGNEYLRAGQYQDAADMFKHILDAGANYSGTWNNLGVALAHLSRNDEAISAWKKASEIDPADIKPLTNLGAQYYSVGDYDAAIDAYQKVLEIDPENGSAKSGLENAREMQRLKNQ